MHLTKNKKQKTKKKTKPNKTNKEIYDHVSSLAF